MSRALLPALEKAIRGLLSPNHENLCMYANNNNDNDDDCVSEGLALSSCYDYDKIMKIGPVRTESAAGLQGEKPLVDRLM